MSEHRLDDLEARYSQLEQTVQSLSEVIWAQQKKLDRLAEVVRELDSRVSDEGLVDASRVDRPPHF